MNKKFKTSIKSWIIIFKKHRVIKFNQNSWLKPDLRKKAKK